jgi:hypothetical protein
VVALPSSIPQGAFLLILIGDLLIFVLIALTFGLLKPKKLSGTIWISPVFHVYTLAAVFIALFEALGSQALLTVAAEFGSFLVAAVIGAFLGVAIGRAIPVTPGPEGKVMYTGGGFLVGLLVFLLLPIAIEQAVVLFGSLAQINELISALSGNAPFNEVLVAVGFLFVLGTFVSLTWRGEVWKKRQGASTPSSPSARSR